MRNSENPASRRRKLGIWFGLLAGAVTLAVMMQPEQARWLMPGPSNTGHESLRCASCHKPAPGAARQQLQAKARYWLHWRNTPADFGFQAVTNEVCLDCHDRPNDRHPVFRFLEPRFAEARTRLGPHRCISCHREHRGRRVTVETTAFCETCHRDTKFKKEPLRDTSHTDLIARKDWTSCLTCHDFHGNHVMKTRREMSAALPPERISDYFAGGPSPYSRLKRYPARKEAQP
jgi:hypothetical protein